MSTNNSPVPIFLLSMPRSGSTLLQRILATHPDIATGPEPTFLLPLLNIATDDEVVATYDQRFTSWAVEDFFDSWDGAAEDLRRLIEEFVRRIYGLASEHPTRYFLDKTPKYHMIASDLLKVFPQAPIIILWRNPLSVIASMMETWGGGGGRWNLHHFRLDLYRGLVDLIDVAAAHPDRICSITYEDLVENSDVALGKVFDHLGLELDPMAVERFSELRLDGRVQDPNVGTEGFRHVRTDRTERWRTVLANPLRKAWCRRYLSWLGRDRLAMMGYDLGELLGALNSVGRSSRFLATDLVLMPYDSIYRVFEVGLFAKKLRQWRRGVRPILAHK